MTIEISKANFTKANVLGIDSTGVKLFAILIIPIFITTENIPKVSQIIGFKIKSNIGFIKVFIRAKVIQNIISLSVPDIKWISGIYFMPKYMAIKSIIENVTNFCIILPMFWLIMYILSYFQKKYN